MSIRGLRPIARPSRRRGQSVRFVTESGAVITVSVRPSHHPQEIKLAVDAPRSVKVERPERDAAPAPSTDS